MIQYHHIMDTCIMNKERTEKRSMAKRKMKQFLAVLAAGAMLCSGFPVNLSTNVIAAETAQAEEFAVTFASEYAQVGKELSAVVTGATNVTYQWYVDEKEVENTTNVYTPTADDLEKWIEVVVSDGTSKVTTKLYCSKLPVVYIDTENGASIVSKEDYINATMKIQGNETYNSENSTLYDGVIEIRGRGNSTWGQPKKPYKIKLDKKTDVFGMGKNKHWVLLANYMDESLMRNTLAYNFSGSLGMEQMSTVWVDVVLNGEYVGNYQFCEQVRVDETRVDVFDWESFAEDSAAVIAEAEGFDKDTTGDLEEYMLETDMSWITSGVVTFGGNTYNISDYPDIEVPSINGGYVLELDEYYDEVSKFKTDSNQPIMFKNPEFVNTNEDMMKFVQTYVQAFEDAVNSSDYTAMYDEKEVHYSELYDFDALVDYWLINEIFFNEEIGKKSTYMYKEIDELMKMGPIWDMDWSSGGEGNTHSTNNWATLYFGINAQADNWYRDLVQDPYFLMSAQERYWEIRYEQLQDMLDSIDVHYEYLKESGAANSAVWTARQTFEADAAGLKQWMNAHVSWMDENMATESVFANSFYTEEDNLKLGLKGAQGETLDADTAEKAPAYATVEQEKDLILTVQGTADISGTAEVYVNGRKSGTIEVGTSEVRYTISADELTAAAGEKDIIEVKVRNSDNKVVAQNYITVKETGCKHAETTVDVVTSPTCIATGTGNRLCTSCKEILEEGITLEKTEHTYSSEFTVDKDATCEEAGSKSKHCTTEGCTAKTDVTVIDKLAHTYGAWTTTKEETCVEEGSKERSCTCGDKQTEVIAKTEHTWDSSYTIDKEATCTEAGSKSKHCTTEGCTAKTDVTAIDKLAHTYGEWVVVKEPTVTSEGLKEKTCTGCGDKQIESIEKLPQIEVPEEVDKAAAQEYYDKCLVYYKADDYTEESWAVYVEAMDALKAALANEEITVEELQAAVDAVSAATEALEAAEDEPVVPEQPDDEDKEDSEDGDKEESVQTGDMTPIMLWGILMLAALLVIMKRRKIA